MNTFSSLFKNKALLIKGVGALVILAIVIAIGFVAQANGYLQDLAAQGGYISVFVLALLNGFNIFVPFVTTSFVPTWTAAGLSFPILIVLITIGMTLADSISFLFGKLGRAVLSHAQGRVLNRLSAWRDRNTKWPLVATFFWVSFIPFPNEVIAIPMGLLKYKARHFIPVMFVGNICFNVLTAIGFLNIVAFL